MKRKIFRILTSLSAAVALGGCFSLDWSVSDVTHEEHVVIRNYGYRLFDCLPIICGNANDSGWTGGIMFFRDDVTIDKLQGRLMKRAKERGKTVYDISYHNYNSMFFNLPLLGFPIPIPYIFTTKDYQISGVMK